MDCCRGWVWVWVWVWGWGWGWGWEVWLLLLCWVHLEEVMEMKETHLLRVNKILSHRALRVTPLIGNTSLHTQWTQRVSHLLRAHNCARKCTRNEPINEEQHHGINRKHLLAHPVDTKSESPYGHTPAPENVQGMNQSIKWTLSSTRFP